MFRRAAAPILLLLAALLIAATGSTSFAESHAFLVGVLRADGIVIPFGAFDGKRWREAWTLPQQDLDVPINVSSVPTRWWGSVGPVEAWQAWIAGSATPRTLHVTQPYLVPANCLRQIGLRTDYRSAQALPPITDHPYPKDGLAVSPAHPVEPIETVPNTAPEWKEFAPIVTRIFNDQEEKLARERDFDHPIPRKQREAVTPAIEAIYAYGRNPRVYAVEAAREYWIDPGPKSTCKALAFGRVWLRRAGAVLSPIGISVGIERCDREDTTFMLPLGVVHAGDRIFWIAQYAGWDEERYDVIEVTPTTRTVVLTRFGGWC